MCGGLLLCASPLVDVRGILNSIAQNLPQGKNRKFIFVETSFFSRWWNEQTEDMKNHVRRLVLKGKR